MVGEKRTRRPSGLKTATVGATFHPPTSVRAGRSRSPIARRKAVPSPAESGGSKKGRCGYFSGWGLFWQSADWVTAGEAAPRERSVEILLQGYSGRCRGFLGQASPVGAGEQLPASYSQLLLGRESLGEVT